MADQGHDFLLPSTEHVILRKSEQLSLALGMQSTLQPPPWPSLLRHLSTVQPALLGCLPKQTKTLASRGTAPHHPTHPRLPVQCASWPLKLEVFGQTQERVPTILEVGETSLMSITPGFTDPGGAWPDLRDQSVLKFKVRVLKGHSAHSFPNKYFVSTLPSAFRKRLLQETDPRENRASKQTGHNPTAAPRNLLECLP